MGSTVYKYALTVVDVASRFKGVEPLVTKDAKEVADALSRIYRRGPLKWSELLQVDPGREFMGAVSQVVAKHNVEVRRGRTDIHQDQGLVERFNQTYAERLFGHQSAHCSGDDDLYYLNEGPARGFVREKLLIVPHGTELLPDRVLIRRTR